MIIVGVEIIGKRKEGQGERGREEGRERGRGRERGGEREGW